MVRVTGQSEVAGGSVISGSPVRVTWPGIWQQIAFNHSGVVQLVAHGPLEPRILVRVQAPEPLSTLTPITKPRKTPRLFHRKPQNRSRVKGLARKQGRRRKSRMVRRI